MENTHSILLELEEGFWRAAGSDGSYYQQHFLDDGLMVLPFKGGVLTKEQIITTVVKADPWQSFQINNPRFLSVTEKQIILIYEASGTRQDNAPAYNALISSHYEQIYGQWRLVFHQQTPIS